MAQKIICFIIWFIVVVLCKINLDPNQGFSFILDISIPIFFIIYFYSDLEYFFKKDEV